MYLLEACVDSVESAIAAQEGGADRLELCGCLMTGGVTPSMSLFHGVKKAVTIPVHALLRPRFGDFCYTSYEYDMLMEDVRTFREEGADGVVIGILTETGALDAARMEGLIQEAGGMHLTLHRAFDLCADPLEALRTARALGIRTVLTSGQKNACLQGKDLLARLVEQNLLTVMAGGGVTAPVIETLARDAGVRVFHMSGKKTLESPMRFRRADVSMGLPLMSEYALWRTDSGEIARARAMLDRLAIRTGNTVS